MSIGSSNGSAPLCGVEGELVSIRITVEPRLLEQLLDVLAQLEFPINPQLYHDAATVSISPDGSSIVAPAAIVEFPGWAGRLEEVRKAVALAGFPDACLTVKAMLDDIHSDSALEPAPAGAPYKAIARSRQALRAIA